MSVIGKSREIGLISTKNGKQKKQIITIETGK